MKTKTQINSNFLLIWPLLLNLIRIININNSNKIIKMVINIIKTQINSTFNSSIICSNKSNITMIKTNLSKQIKTMTCLTKKRNRKDMLARLMQEQVTSGETKKMKTIPKKDKKQNLQIIMRCLKNYSQMKKMGLLSSHSTQVNLIMTQ